MIRRITGKTPGTYLREEIAGPLKLDVHIGVDASFDPRIAELIGAPPPPPDHPDQLARMSVDPESMMFKAIANPRPVVDPALTNSRAWRGAEVPAANGHTNARALATLYGALATGGELNGYRVLTPASIKRAYTEQANGPDLILGVVSRWGLGFALNQPNAPVGTESAHVWASGGGRLDRICRSGRARRVWLHDESDGVGRADRWACVGAVQRDVRGVVEHSPARLRRRINPLYFSLKPPWFQASWAGVTPAPGTKKRCGTSSLLEGFGKRAVLSLCHSERKLL